MSTKRLAILYFFVAILWVIFSDLILPKIINSHYIFAYIYEVGADLIFFIISIWIFYVLIRRDIANQHKITAAILRAQDLERKRISREIHDELGQSLIALKLKLSKILSKTQKSELQDINDIIEKVRDFSWILSPGQLEDIGLVPALNSLFERINRINSDIIIKTNNIEEIKDCFSTESNISIFRIFQEIMTNILKYSNAPSVDISIVKKNDYVFFRVKDNGVGFDPKKLSFGVGLASIKERIASMKGKIRIDSQKGHGTDITFQIPIEIEGGA
jgi:signal transduction histidine kinase